jgi:hypothetical protein
MIAQLMNTQNLLVMASQPMPQTTVVEDEGENGRPVHQILRGESKVNDVLIADIEAILIGEGQEVKQRGRNAEYGRRQWSDLIGR